MLQPSKEEDMPVEPTKDQENQPETLLTVEEVAKQLRVSTGLVYSWLSGGQLNGIKLPGRARGTWRITQSAVQEFLQQYAS